MCSCFLQVHLAVAAAPEVPCDGNPADKTETMGRSAWHFDLPVRPGHSAPPQIPKGTISVPRWRSLNGPACPPARRFYIAASRQAPQRAVACAVRCDRRRPDRFYGRWNNWAWWYRIGSSFCDRIHMRGPWWQHFQRQQWSARLQGEALSPCLRRCAAIWLTRIVANTVPRHGSCIRRSPQGHIVEAHSRRRPTRGFSGGVVPH